MFPTKFSTLLLTVVVLALMFRLDAGRSFVETLGAESSISNNAKSELVDTSDVLIIAAENLASDGSDDCCDIDCCDDDCLCLGHSCSSNVYLNIALIWWLADNRAPNKFFDSHQFPAKIISFPYRPPITA